MKKLSVISFLAMHAMLSFAYANNNAAVNSTTTVTQAPKKQSNIWSGFVSANRSTNLIDHEDGTRFDGMDYTARLNLKFSKNFSARAQTGYSQDLKDSENSDLANTSLTLQRSPFAIHNRLNMNYRVGMVLPTSKESYKRQSLRTALTTGATFIINNKYLIKGLDIVAGLGFTRNFHQYEEAYDGAVNTKMTAVQNLSISYTFPNSVYLSADFSHANSWSYQNTMKDSFSISQEIGVEINRTFSVAAGHSNSGNTLKSNGYDSNVKVFDENSSIVYVSGTMAF